MRQTARLVDTKEPVFPTIKMAACNASVTMDTQENLVVSFIRTVALLELEL